MKHISSLISEALPWPLSGAYIYRVLVKIPVKENLREGDI